MYTDFQDDRMNKVEVNLSQRHQTANTPICMAIG